MSIKTDIVNNVKNIIGWKTSRKIVVISVDDYGNVRLDSKEARANMDRAGLKVTSRFDAYDTLESGQDLEILYETLSSVKDSKGRHAIFTPYALPCNINFEKMAEEGYKNYHYETLPETYAKLKGYEGSWAMWQEGIKRGLMVPQFHGREHVNLKVFNEKLQKHDEQLLTSLKNRSFTSIASSGYKTIAVSASFDFWKYEENEAFNDIITDGLNRFEEVFGYRATNFIAPGGRENPVIHKVLKENGIKYIDVPLVKMEHQGEGKYKKIFNFTGRKNQLGQVYEVRNVVFEPTDNRGFDWVENTISQIGAAFRWGSPAIISSHRVNFSGHADENNRAVGIKALRGLLQKIVEKWPDVEFMGANELGDLIASGKK